MKRIFILVIIFILYGFNTGVAQTYTYAAVTNVRTPNNSIVQDVFALTSNDVTYSPSQLAALASDLAANYNGAELIDAPSYRYNCHAYAWYVSEGGSKVWIGKNLVTAEDIFWTDGSYMEVTEDIATKVSYHQDGNHSAIRINSTWYQSKWGADVLVRHHPNDVPTIYQPSKTKKYYKRTFISGPDIVPCSGTVTYTIQSVSSSVSWTVSSNLQIVSGQGTNSITVQAKSNITDRTASVSANGNLTKSITVGAPFLTSIDGPSTTSTGTVYYYAYPSFSTTLGSYEWIVAPMTGVSLTQYSNVLAVTFTQTGNYNIICRSVSPCTNFQSPLTKSVYVNSYSSGSYVISTGTSRQVSVSLANPERLTTVKGTVSYALVSSTTGATVAKGQLAASGGTLDFSAQPTGIYILQIETGSGTPETFKIVLK